MCFDFDTGKLNIQEPVIHITIIFVCAQLKKERKKERKKEKKKSTHR